MAPYLPDEVLLNIFIKGCEYERQYTPDAVDLHPRRRKAFAALVRAVCTRWRSAIDHPWSKDVKFWIIRTGFIRTPVSGKEQGPMYKDLIFLRDSISNADACDLEVYFILIHHGGPQTNGLGPQDSLLNQKDTLELEQLFHSVQFLQPLSQQIVKVLIQSNILQTSSCLLQLLAHLTPLHNLRYLEVMALMNPPLRAVWGRYWDHNKARRFHSLIPKALPPDLTATLWLDTLVLSEPEFTEGLCTPEVRSLVSKMYVYNDVKEDELLFPPSLVKDAFLNITKLKLNVDVWVSRESASLLLPPESSESGLYHRFPKLLELDIWLHDKADPGYKPDKIQVDHVANLLMGFSCPVLEAAVIHLNFREVETRNLSTDIPLRHLYLPSLVKFDYTFPTTRSSLNILKLYTMRSKISTLCFTLRPVNHVDEEFYEKDAMFADDCKSALSHLAPQELMITISLQMHKNTRLNRIFSSLQLRAIEKVSFTLRGVSFHHHKPILISTYKLPSLKTIQFQFFTFAQVRSLLSSLWTENLHSVTICHRADEIESESKFSAALEEATNRQLVILSVRAVALYLLRPDHRRALELMNYIAPNIETIFVAIECNKTPFEAISFLRDLHGSKEKKALFPYLQVLYVRIVLDDETTESIEREIEKAFNHLLRDREYPRRLVVQSVDAHHEKPYVPDGWRKSKWNIDVFICRDGGPIGIGPDLLSLLNTAEALLYEFR